MAEYLTVPEAASYLRISARKVYDLVSRSGLPHRRAGARLLFERTALAEWVRAGGQELGMAAPPLVLAGSHDALMDWAVRASQSTMATLCRGSRDGLERVLRGEACAALLHLPGPDARQFNVDAVGPKFAGHDVALVNWCWRQQGLIVARGNPRRIGSLADLCDSALHARPKIGRRSAGAGSRELFDQLIGKLTATQAAPAAPAAPVSSTWSMPPARSRKRQQSGRKLARKPVPSPTLDLVLDNLDSENDAAIAVQHGHVDAVFGAQSAAQSFGLGFVPVMRERVDLLINRRSYFEPPLQALLGFCRTPAFADYAKALGGYELAEHGSVIWNAA